MTSEGESQNSGAAVDRNQSETYIGIPNPHNYCLFQRRLTKMNLKTDRTSSNRQLISANQTIIEQVIKLNSQEIQLSSGRGLRHPKKISQLKQKEAKLTFQTPYLQTKHSKSCFKTIYQKSIINQRQIDFPFKLCQHKTNLEILQDVLVAPYHLEVCRKIPALKLQQYLSLLQIMSIKSFTSI